jgi:N-acetylmuramoyl-L-alanine amidase
MLVQLQKGDIDGIARTVWAESRGEPVEGQHAVVWVVVNRLRREPGRFPKTLQGVVKQRAAFSCWLPSDPQCARMKAVDESDQTFVVAMKATLDVLTGTVPDPVSGADHYFSTSIEPPSWAASMTFVRKLGRHRFYRERS